MVAYYQRIDRALHQVRRIDTTTGSREGRGLWIADAPIRTPKSYDYKTAIDAAKILIVSNAKGGVATAMAIELSDPWKSKSISKIDLGRISEKRPARLAQIDA
jgi:hypothetical protein